MSERHYEALIARLEGEARTAPGTYKAKVALLATLGFAVMGGSVAIALGLSVGLVAVLVATSPVLLLKLLKVVWIPVAFGWIILKSLWVRFEPPYGYHLRPGEAPALEEEVETLRRATGAPALDGIVVDHNLNAAAITLPRVLGLLGQRHYLLLGLPLLQSLDREQFAAVVAHEFGHFGGGHARFAGWIYRVRVSWLRVLHALAENDAWLTGLFVRFFDWYAPYFNAYSFVLARGNEYVADAIAARVAGAPAVARALVRTRLGSERLAQDFWPALERDISRLPEPPEALYRHMAASLREPSETDAERLRAALAEAPDYFDTHPTLAQRLAALRVDADAVPAVSDAPSAAELLLGPLLPALEQRFSEEWRAGVDEGWRDCHRRLQEGAAALR